jgi:sRNA-binding protein
MHDVTIDTTAASRTEGEPISNRRARREELKRTIVVIAELFPAAFVADKWAQHRPLKIGIHVDLVATGLVTPRECTIALTAYTGRLQYQRAIATGGSRVDLGGNIAGEVTQDQIEHAVAVVASIEAKAIAKAEAVRKEKALRKAAKEMAAEQHPASRTPPSPPPPPSDGATPRRLGLADLKHAAAARRNGGAP